MVGIREKGRIRMAHDMLIEKEMTRQRICSGFVNIRARILESHAQRGRRHPARERRARRPLAVSMAVRHGLRSGGRKDYRSDGRQGRRAGMGRAPEAGVCRAAEDERRG